MPSAEFLKSLGERIVQVARLAVQSHVAGEETIPPLRPDSPIGLSDETIAELIRAKARTPARLAA